MIATARLKDSKNNTVGFILNNKFCSNYYVMKNINKIENLSLVRNNGDYVIRAKKSLPIKSYREEITLNEYKELIQTFPIERDIQSYLLNWKNRKLHKFLRIDGARQIGKTTEIKKFAYKNYEYVIYINLASDVDRFVSLLKRKVNFVELFTKYCELSGLPQFVNDKSTIIIIDEIQISKEVYNSIKNMEYKCHCDIIMTGSYLGKLIEKDYFTPVGSVETVKMYPLSFREFTNIYGYADKLDNLNLIGLDTQEIYDKLTDLYYTYRVVGGFPYIVSIYLDTHNIQNCFDAFGQLLNMFKEESRAYFNDIREVTLFDEVYRSAIYQIANVRNGSKNYDSNLIEFMSSYIKESTKTLFTLSEVNNVINWIINSGLIGLCDMYLDGSYTNFFPARRIYFIDCGLTNYIGKLYGVEPSNLKGVITETFVYNELLRLYNKANSSIDVSNISSKKYEDVNISNLLGNRPAFSILGNYELDFMVVKGDKSIYGLEVKSKKGTYVSLNKFKEKGLINYKIVLKDSKGGYDSNNKILTIPIYAIGTGLDTLKNYFIK